MSSTHQTPTQRFNIEEIPLVNLFVATDKQRRLRLSSDIIALYDLSNGNRVTLGYDHSAQVIALRLASSASDPTAANVDKRGYVSAAHFYRKTGIPQVARRYVFIREQDGWLTFGAEG